MKLPLHLKLALWAVGVSLILFTVIDLWLAVRPLEPAQVAWRFNALTVLSSGVVTPLLGVLCILGATVNAPKGGRLALAGVLTVVALFLLMSAGSLVLDTVQLRQTVMDELLLQYDLNSVRALMKLTLAAMVLLTVSGALFWTARSPRRQRNTAAVASPQRRTETAKIAV
jgi:hypothetical protein